MSRETFEKWETGLPVSRALYTVLVEHGDDGLVILVEEVTEPKKMIRLKFPRPLSYREIGEGDRLKDMAAISKVEHPLIVVVNSNYLRWFHEQSLGVHLSREISHYLVITADDCIDVLTESAPSIEYVESPES